MKLNYNCIRDLLLVLEEALLLNENLQFNSLDLDDLVSIEKLKQYGKSTIAYSILNLEEAGFIDAHIACADDGIAYISVSNITYCGHEFLATIRPKSVWDKLLSYAKPIGTLSIPIIHQIAAELITSSILPLS